MPAPAPAVSAPAVSVPISGGTGADPIATFKVSQQAVVDEIVGAIPDLELKPDFCWEDGQVGGVTATLEARDAPGQAELHFYASDHASS